MVSRSSIFTGFVVALLVHAIIFVPGGCNTKPVSKEPDKSIRKIKKVVVVSPPPKPELEEPEIECKTEPPEPVSSSSKQAPREPEDAFGKVVDQATRKKLPGLGNTSSQTEGDSLLSLRIAWESPGQLCAVAQDLGLKVVAVNSSGEIMGEVDTIGDPTLKSFTSCLSNFSNRVRTLPKFFFGPGMALSSKERISAFWVLVPENIDREFLAVQNRAVGERGLNMLEVSVVEAVFEHESDHYQLVVKAVQ